MSDNSKLNKAVALGYRSVDTDTPVVLASGAGVVAKRLIAIAQEHGIHIESNQALADALSRLDVGQIIPPELYKAVAEVLAFVYSLDEEGKIET